MRVADVLALMFTVMVIVLALLFALSVASNAQSVPAGWAPTPATPIISMGAFWGYSDEAVRVYPSPVPTNEPLLTPMPAWLWQALSDDNTAFAAPGLYPWREYVPHSGYHSHYHGSHYYGSHDYYKRYDRHR